MITTNGRTEVRRIPKGLAPFGNADFFVRAIN